MSTLLFFVMMSVPALIEIHSLATKEPFPTKEHFQGAAFRICTGASLISVMAFGFSSSHVIWRLRDRGILITLFTGGMPLARLPRVFLSMGFSCFFVSCLAGMIANLFDTQPTPQLTRTYCSWLWHPEAPACSWIIPDDSLCLFPSSDVKTDPHYLRPFGSPLLFASIGGFLTVLSAYIGLMASSKTIFSLISSVMFVSLVIAAGFLANPTLTMITSAVVCVVLDRVFVFRGLRS